jgi:transposase
LTTKIHALVDALGNPVVLMLTPGQAHDLACAEPLLDGVDPQALIGDKAYDADALIDTLNRREITPVIPSKANRKTPRACDFALYCERNLVEHFFNKLKHFRAIATRYDKLARNFLAGVQLAAARRQANARCSSRANTPCSRMSISMTKVTTQAITWTMLNWPNQKKNM